MAQKVKKKWIFIGLGAGLLLLIALGTVIVVLTNHEDLRAPFGGTTPDMGESLHEFGRPATWNVTHMTLGDIGFRAAAGPFKYTDEDNQDWDYYSIDIEKPEGKSSYVFFQRDLKMDKVPVELVDRKVQDIVTYDENSRLVTFTIGSNIYRYTLPNR